ncbi:MAG: response regulator [bacterium]|nr:response regulator [bacterium]
MKSTNRVLVVEDQAGDIKWLFDIITFRGYEVDLATNEEAARKLLLAVKKGKKGYALAIFDVMVAIKDIMELVDVDDRFYKESRNTGVRLCEYARRELRISYEKLPIVCLSARDDQELKRALANLGIKLFDRIPKSGSASIREYLEKNLTQLGP